MSPKKKSRIKLSGKPVIVSDTQIQLSDQKLRSLLSAMYEKGENDARRFSPWKSYAPCFSVALTLLIALLTSEFHPVFGFSSETVTAVAFFLLSVSALLGFVFLLYGFQVRNSDLTEKRDKAIEETMKGLNLDVDPGID